MAASVYIALGSNMGNRARFLSSAMEALRALSTDGQLEASSIYETAPVGPGEQANYYNAVVCFQTTFSPHELLQECLRIEQANGRVRTRRWGPRTLDLDILLYGRESISTDELSIPHPRITERPFVLKPLCDLAPDCEIAGQSVTMHLERLLDSDRGDVIRKV